MNRRGNNPAPASGEFTIKDTTAGRGQWRTTRGGARGIYVGTRASGLEWFVYSMEDFGPACREFDGGASC